MKESTRILYLTTAGPQTQQRLQDAYKDKGVEFIFARTTIDMTLAYNYQEFWIDTDHPEKGDFKNLEILSTPTQIMSEEDRDEFATRWKQ